MAATGVDGDRTAVTVWTDTEAPFVSSGPAHVRRSRATTAGSAKKSSAATDTLVSLFRIIIIYAVSDKNNATFIFWIVLWNIGRFCQFSSCDIKKKTMNSLL